MPDTFEVSACARDGDCIVANVPETDAQFFTVYRRGADGLAQALHDFLTRADADAYRATLTHDGETAR